MVVTYTYLLQIAERALSNATSQVVASALEATVAITFSAFALEAFLSDLGCDCFVEWERWEDKAPRPSVWEKLKRLHAELGLLAPEFAGRPYSSFETAVRFRNQLAHGRTARGTIPDDEMFGMPTKLVEWEKIACAETASLIVEDAEKIMHMLSRAGLGREARLHVRSVALSR